MPHEAKSPPLPSILKHDSREAIDTCASPSSYLGLRYNDASPRATLKSVSISSQRDVISPLVLGKQKPVEELDLAYFTDWRKPVKRVSSYRLTGRSSKPSSPSLRPLVGTSNATPSADATDPQSLDDRNDHLILLEQVAAWVKNERSKLFQQNAAKATTGGESHQTESDGQAEEGHAPNSFNIYLDLDSLEDILKRSSLKSQLRPRRRSSGQRNRASIRKLLRKNSGASSDTDYFDGAALVPSCDDALDNSKTLAYTGGASEDEDSDSEDLTRVASYRHPDAWAKFKFEIVRLAHTLRLKGWRSAVPLDDCKDIVVQRLSGALTNAVYVVSPPIDQKYNRDDTTKGRRKPPQRLLLRVYGPNVGHLIDRGTELGVLQRLARKRIGPRLLGTFANGRFEEYFHAKALTPEDLRNPDTSRQIAKRMRELHDGVELLDQERDDGPFVWRNWDKWVQRVEKVVCWLDDQVATLPPGYKPTGNEAWKRRGHICGVPWSEFRKAVEKYRTWLEAQYNSPRSIREQLVFAHNDTQYGNILRMVPTGESPLLLPANSHKQLIVIDFEYASANLPGLEFANHFTEWCYNYHDERKPYTCHANRYPTLEEQDRFVRAYVRHRPQFNISTPQMTPEPGPPTSSPSADRKSTTSISDFMLDARGPARPPILTPQESFDSPADNASEDAEVARLLRQTRMWRVANTAQWVAWGLVQAKVPGMPSFGDGPEPATELAREDIYRNGSQHNVEVQEQQEEQEEFDYLGYAQHRAMFFWGDAIQLGIVGVDDLPEEVRGKVKTVAY